MTTETGKLSAAGVRLVTPAAESPVRSATASVTANSEQTRSDQTATAAADSSAISDAVETVRTHLVTRTTPPEFKVDYLSGLGVMTIRSASTGEVVMQLPDTEAVKLAQLIKSGSPLDSLGINTKV